MDFDFDPTALSAQVNATREAQERTKTLLADRLGVLVQGQEIDMDGQTYTIIDVVPNSVGYYWVVPKVEEGEERLLVDARLLFDPTSKTVMTRIQEDPAFFASQMLSLMGDMLSDPTVIKAVSHGEAEDPLSKEEVNEAMFELRKAMGLLEN